jgi:hypothetical protein
VLVEPGTPAGFANVAEARAALLTSEGRKAAKVARRAAAAGVSGRRLHCLLLYPLFGWPTTCHLPTN